MESDKTQKILWASIKTTGLDCNKHSLVRLALMLEGSGGVEVSDCIAFPVYNTHFDPRTMKVNGLTREEIYSVDSMERPVEDFNKFISSVYNKEAPKIIIGGFDTRFILLFLGYFSERFNVPLFKVVRKNFQVDVRYLVAQYLVGKEVTPSSSTLSKLIRFFELDDGSNIAFDFRKLYVTYLLYRFISYGERDIMGRLEKVVR